MMGRISLETIGISCIVGILSLNPLQAQVIDDFSDGNLNSNPCWVGDTNRFEVNTTEQLHLKSSGTDSSVIITASQLLDSTEWIFWIKMSFSPSANNYCRVYLASDNIDLTEPLNGFYLQLGEAGSSDAIELFRQQGTQHISVCRGKEAFIAASFSIKIRLTRNSAGLWTLYVDSTGGNVFLEQASGWDSTIINPQYFGIYCKYTSSNATKFYFDEVIVRNIQLDLSPPSLIAIKIPDVNHLELLFNEAMEATTISDSLHYFVDQGIGFPDGILFSSSDLSRIILYFSSGFIPQKQYNIHLSGLMDLADNQIVDTTISFQYYRPSAYDIVFNEIMADPEPQVGLPPVEYLELYNTTNYNIDLDGWKLQIGSTSKTISTYTLPPLSYLLLADSNARPLFSSNLHFLGFPTFSLSNEGSSLTLTNAEGQLIHNVQYSSEWYNDPLKAEGGWALEQIDPLNPCSGKGNWKFSISNFGGTPGTINSVRDDNPDNIAPQPDRISVTDPRNITLFFTESLDSTCLKGITSFKIQPGDQFPESIKYQMPNYSSIGIELPSSMQKGVQYELVILDTLKDCAGNISLNGFVLPFGLPEEPEIGDVVINEVLFDPENEVPEFFEIYNTSNKIIGLNSLLLAETDSLTLQITDKYLLSADCRLLFPQEYQAFTSDPDALRKEYQTTHPSGIFLMLSFPPLGNTGGCISLINRQDQILDAVKYSPDMHYPLLSTIKGVSLERINPSAPGMSRENWHSASSSCGYATPAMRNSQAIDRFNSTSVISMEPPIFSPDNDGYQDLLMIHCNPVKPGYQANISVFNTAGQVIRIIANNALLGNEEVFIWDGIDERGYKAPIGMYIVFFELFNTTGDVRHLKKVTVLGGRL